LKTPSHKIFASLIVLVGLMTISLGIMLAQTETPSPTPDPNIPTPTVRPVDLACDLDTLRAEQQTLADQLATFDPDAESNPGLALDNLFKVGAAYQELALQCGYIPADAATRTVGTDVERILTTLQDINGDPINGQVLYNGDLGCAGCHEGDNHVGPATEGTYTRIEETRLNDPALAGYTIEQYIVESIVQPGQYVVPGHQNIMPTNFGDRLTAQEMADLLLFLESQDGPSPE
jgi:mono/diheme cytochrome c family protein